MADDVITLLTTDHRELQRLLDLMSEDRSFRALALPLAVAMLEAHSEAEEEQVYPVLAREARQEEQAEHAAEEHHKAERLGRQLLDMDVDSEEFDRALQEWTSAILHHVEEEENDLLPALRQALTPARLQELGLAFAQRRSQALAGRHATAGGEDGERGGQRAGTAETRKELYDKARDLDIEGRSTMKKDELAEEVHRAEAGGDD